MLLPSPPSNHQLRHSLARNLVPCAVIYASPREKPGPRITVFRMRTTGDFITRIEMRMPETIRSGFVGRTVTDLIQIAQLEDSLWSASRITSVEEQPIRRRGRKPKTRPAPPPIGYRTFVYSR